MAYIDIYGFSAEVRKFGADPVYKRLSDSMEKISKIAKRNKIYLVSLSDSIFLISPISGQKYLEALSLIISNLEEAQDKLVDQDFFPRGGIAQGPLNMSGSIVVGEAIIEAVRLEQKLKIPCIVAPVAAVGPYDTELTFWKEIEIRDPGASEIGLMAAYPIFPRTLVTYKTRITKAKKKALLEGPGKVARELQSLERLVEEYEKHDLATDRPNYQRAATSTKRNIKTK